MGTTCASPGNRRCRCSATVDLPLPGGPTMPIIVLPSRFRSSPARSAACSKLKCGAGFFMFCAIACWRAQIGRTRKKSGAMESRTLLSELEQRLLAIFTGSHPFDIHESSIEVGQVAKTNFVADVADVLVGLLEQLAGL